MGPPRLAKTASAADRKSMPVTEGVECHKDADVIDEMPMSYKDIDAVMAA